MKISIGLVLALVAAIGVGLVAVSFFPIQPSFEGSPVPLLTEIGAEGLNCSLSNGTCSMTIVNNGTVAVSLDSCQMGLAGPNGTSGIIQGTIGGQAVRTGIPAGSQATASCRLPTNLLSYERSGTPAEGGFQITLDGQWYSDPAGTKSGFSFQGIWY